MTENKSEKTGKKKNNQNNNRGNGKLGDNFWLIGIGSGAILLVLAEIVCILGEIYYMLSSAASVVVIIISAFLLLGVTGIFLYIIRNTLLEKMNEQQQAYEKLLQINEVVCGEMEERDEKLYKRQLSVAKAQIKRTRESVMNMVRANEYIIDVIEEKLGEDSVLSSYGAALNEVQESVAQLRELCEGIADGRPRGIVSEILPETTEILPELDEILLEPEEEMPELTEILLEPEEEMPELTEILPESEEPVSVEIEPLPEDVLENIGKPEMEAMLDELVPEPEIELEEFLPEPEVMEMEEELSEPEVMEIEEELPEPEMLEMEEDLPVEDAFLPEAEIEEIEVDEEEPEEEASLEEDKDTGKPMSMEDIAALFNNL